MTEKADKNHALKKKQMRRENLHLLTVIAKVQTLHEKKIKDWRGTSKQLRIDQKHQLEKLQRNVPWALGPEATHHLGGSGNRTFFKINHRKETKAALREFYSMVLWHSNADNPWERLVHLQKDCKCNDFNNFCESITWITDKNTNRNGMFRKKAMTTKYIKLSNKTTESLRHIEEHKAKQHFGTFPGQCVRKGSKMKLPETTWKLWISCMRWGSFLAQWVQLCAKNCFGYNQKNIPHLQQFFGKIQHIRVHFRLWAGKMWLASIKIISAYPEEYFF